MRKTLICCGFTVMAAMILSAFEFAGFGVDGDALAIGPVASDAQVVAHLAQSGNSIRSEAGLHVEPVGLILVVKAGRVNSLLDVETALCS